MLKKILCVANVLLLSFLSLARATSGLPQLVPPDLSRQAQQPKERIELNSRSNVFQNDLKPKGPTETVGLTPAPVLENTPTIEQLPDFVAENKSFLHRIASLLEKTKAKAKEIGFLNRSLPNPETVRVSVGKMMLVDKQKYALNFDGGELIYFDLPKIVAIPGVAPRQTKFIFAHRKSAFSQEGQVFLSKSIKNFIMDNAINKADTLEANHISIDNGRIFLDRKEERVNNLPVNDNYIHQTVDTIKNHAGNQSAENLLDVVWRPQKIDRYHR